MYKTLTFSTLVNSFRWDFDSPGAMQCARCISKHIKQSCMWQKSFVEWQHNPWTATKTNVPYVNWYDVYATWLFFSVRLKWRAECVTPLMWKEKQSLPHTALSKPGGLTQRHTFPRRIIFLYSVSIDFRLLLSLIILQRSWSVPFSQIRFF